MDGIMLWLWIGVIVALGVLNVMQASALKDLEQKYGWLFDDLRLCREKSKSLERQNEELSRAHAAELDRLRKVHEIALAALKQQAADVEQKYIHEIAALQRKHQDDLNREYEACTEMIDSQQSRIVALEQEVEGLREVNPLSLYAWTRELRNARYSSEVEVEAKFIYPLLRLLGFPIQNISMRHSIRTQFGSQSTNLVADWVVWENHHGRDRQAAIVVEAKAPSQELTKEVQEQARSYAFFLNAPTYIITNGKRLMVFSRGVSADECTFDADVAKELGARWQYLRSLVGCDGDGTEMDVS